MVTHLLHGPLADLILGDVMDVIVLERWVAGNLELAKLQGGWGVDRGHAASIPGSRGHPVERGITVEPPPMSLGFDGGTFTRSADRADRLLIADTHLSHELLLQLECLLGAVDGDGHLADVERRVAAFLPSASSVTCGLAPVVAHHRERLHLSSQLCSSAVQL